MKIYSKFTDYYDHVRSFGIDPLLTYERHERKFYPEELKHKLPEDAAKHYLRVGRSEAGNGRWQDSRLVRRMVIGFCGKTYKVASVETGGALSAKDVEYVYDPARAEALFPPPESWERFGRRWRQQHKTDGETLAEFLTQDYQLKLETFLELKTPVFVLRPDPDEGYQAPPVIITNCCLKDYQFFRVMDPVTAFQELSMFIGNFLLKKDDPQPIPNEYMIAEKGFDKHSFRHPTRVKDLR